MLCYLILCTTVLRRLQRPSYPALGRSYLLIIPWMLISVKDFLSAILNFVLEGDSLKAIELTEELAPNLLENDMDLHFDLLSLHFIELVRSRKCTEALEFGQKRLTPFGKVPKYVVKLEDFMALLAYEEPEKSPMFHLLSPEYRQNVADSLNRAILANANLPAYSSLERVIQQSTVVRQYLQQEVGKDSYPPFSLKAFLNK
ncbi:glucose-induced degradation protein 8 homolog isoform X3 [Brachypodium distachyon]|uniref:glucose-induced degradation protein 8 homolog isoform X3 n=1 Tax=Brachypodium distachyon TaxID=15368 RepID=UPI000D0CFB2C|nr:glucose-induced degradation protein 8 homolog isoform X3 [Brachypodium distachyon]|eukprot:XP_024315499.1 glucose-induced degradation protein 8 homolog isoform X3 [Brachypodium distachyon]